MRRAGPAPGRLPRWLDVGEVRHLAAGEWQPGPEPGRRDYNSLAHFSDPDGNTWVLQEVGYARAAQEG